MHASSHAQFLCCLKNRFVPALIAICTQHMKWFATLHAYFWRIGENVGTDFAKLIAFFFCVPCFKLSYAFFKLAYRLNQFRLRRLCSEDFFRQFYDRSRATTS